MKLNNPWMRLTVQAHGKRFLVVKVAKTLDEANAYCAAHAGCGLIASDDDGNHYIAEFAEFKGGAK